MTNRLRHTLRAAGIVALLAAPAIARTQRAPAPVRHVFVIMLENHGFDSTFAPNSAAPYFADTLTKAGAFVRQYHGTGHVSLDNYISMISGLAPTRQTQIDCPRFVEFERTGTAEYGQPVGQGCVYPADVKTVANQLDAKGLTWRAYMEDMGADPNREHRTCGHPVIGSVDSTQRAMPADQYATKHNPFVYFHSIIDTPACDQNVVALPALEENLKSIASTPNFAFISPNLCHDGHDRPCKNGEPGGLVSADAFLRHWVPVITSSPAFRADGMLVITFDEALTIDATACCGEQSGPNVLKAGINGPGGGRIGAVVLSPFIKPGTVSNTPYNHYSFLKTVEDIFGLDHLGYAAQPGVDAFGRDVFAKPRE